jgi:hypothetical protein
VADQHVPARSRELWTVFLEAGQNGKIALIHQLAAKTASSPLHARPGVARNCITLEPFCQSDIVATRTVSGSIDRNVFVYLVISLESQKTNFSSSGTQIDDQVQDQFSYRTILIGIPPGGPHPYDFKAPS